MPRLIDISGKRFGRLTVIKKAASATSGRKQTKWECLCDCGQTAIVWKTSLTSGVQVSCGCYMREVARQTIKNRATTHGMRHSPEYSVWSGIRRRCLNPHEKSYPRYGGRGIKVLFSDFDAFFREVGPKPSSAHSIDRIDPDGDYGPGNVRWATRREQARNKRNSLRAVVDGQEVPLIELCEKLGVSYQKVWHRISVLGWSVELALESRAHQVAHGPGMLGGSA